MELIHVGSIFCPQGEMVKPGAEPIDIPRTVGRLRLAKTNVYAPVGPRGVGRVFDPREPEGTEHELVELGGAAEVAHREVDVIKTERFHATPLRWHIARSGHTRTRSAVLPNLRAAPLSSAKGYGRSRREGIGS